MLIFLARLKKLAGFDSSSVDGIHTRPLVNGCLLSSRSCPVICCHRTYYALNER